MLPDTITVLFRETVTPDAAVAFSQIEVARRLGEFNLPIHPAEEFDLPLDTLYGAFTYNNMQDGARWTALWYRGSDVVCVETQPWDGGTGGYGYTECAMENWLPGEYEIQIFVGETWIVSAQFDVLSQDPAAAESSVTPTIQPGMSPTP